MWTTLLRNDARLFLAEQRRYALESLVSTAVFVLIFTGVFYGSTRLMGGEDVRPTYVGFLSWLIGSSIVGGITKAVSDDISNGTLEVQNTFATSYRTLLLSRAFVRLAYDIVVLLACVGTMTVVAEVEPFPPGSLPIVGLFTVSSAIPAAGIGLLLAGVQVYAKRAQVVVLVGMVLLAVSVYLGGSSLPATAAMPCALNAAYAKAMSTGGYPDTIGVAMTGVVSVGYLTLGYFAFQVLLDRAKREGTLGQL